MRWLRNATNVWRLLWGLDSERASLICIVVSVWMKPQDIRAISAYFASLAESVEKKETVNGEGRSGRNITIDKVYQHG